MGTWIRQYMPVNSNVCTSQPRKTLNHYLPGPTDGGLGADVHALSITLALCCRSKRTGLALSALPCAAVANTHRLPSVSIDLCCRGKRPGAALSILACAVVANTHRLPSLALTCAVMANVQALPFLSLEYYLTGYIAI
jgi:hypothetical protein